ncbi:MAG: SsrA-binding protein SmpB [bacterium]
MEIIATNRKAKFDYYFIEIYEAGIVLTGCEIKSVREKKINFKDSFAQIKNNQVYLYNLHISPYEKGNRFNLEATRVRKLLLKKKEIKYIFGQVCQKGLTLIPIEIYLKRNLAKVKLALAKGKKTYDKRETIKKRDVERELKRMYKK